MGVRDGSRWLVRQIDLSVRAGEIVTLIGPNGSGKSTTVRALLGLIDPDEGVVERAPGLRVGYVPQRLQIEATLPMTVARLLTLSAPHGRREVEAALEATGVAHLADSPVQQLSGGEFQRALLARAIVGRPQLLVLDEPVQGVDFTGEIRLYELIREIRDATGCGVLLVSHDLHLVMAQADTVLCLNGHICCRGTPQAVADDPEYVRLFGPRGARTLAVYHHVHDHEHLPDGTICHDDHTDHATHR